MSRKNKPERFDFESLFLETIPVQIGGVSYTLHEASTDVNAKYRSAIFLSGTKRKSKRGDVEISVDKLPDMDIMLLSLCLTEDATGHHVPESQIRTWPNRISGPLLDALKSMSGMELEPEDDEDGDQPSANAEYQEELKNSPSDGTDGSA